MKPAKVWPQSLLLVGGITGLAALMLSLLSPSWLRLGGISPNWLVLWLLPWSLSQGSHAGLMGAVFLGFSLETLTIGAATPLYGLGLLAWLWGRLRRYYHLNHPNPLTMATQAILGSLAVDLTLMVQLHLMADLCSPQMQFGPGSLCSHGAPVGWSGGEIAAAGLYGTMAAAVVTGLLAPLVSTVLLRLWYRLDGSHHD